MNAVYNIEDCRYLSDTQLIYDMTNSRKVATQFEECVIRNEEYPLDMLLQELTPGRKRVAQAAIEIYKRTIERSKNKAKMIHSRNIFETMHPLIGDLGHEEFWIILLNSANNVIRKVRLSAGGLASTCADVRLMIKQAVMHNAVAVAIVHNHPSGSPTPSMQDDKLTQTVKKAMDTMQISFLDHVIVCKSGYYSYADEGRI